jgi:hypothetical protein
MSEYQRTAIRRLSVKRYRSLKDVVLEDLPPLIVLFGPNGSGKSNILRAAQLVLRAARRPATLPFRREEAVSVPLQEADRELDLRPDDFRYGETPEIRIDLEIDLGVRANELLLPPDGISLSRLELECVFQLVDNQTIRYWFTGASCDNGLQLGEPADPNDRRNQKRAADLRLQQSQHRANLQAQRQKVAQLEERTNGQLSPQQQQQRATALHVVSDVTAQIGDIEKQIRKVESALSQESFLVERILNQLIPRLLQTSDAYRIPDGPTNPQAELFQASLSEDPSERAAIRRLGKRLARARLFGASAESVPLTPVESRTYGEKQIRFQHPVHGELPLRNLGSGEQQLVLMLAQRVITPFPIAHLEEPEAHLHRKLMEPLASLLRESVLGDDSRPDVDQLWIATHHHYFAITPDYFDVSVGEHGQTVIRRRKRDEAVKHFYEPSPYWDTLRELVKEGMDPDQIVSLDADGQPISARDILESISGDRRLANEFVNAATKAFVLSLADGQEQ